MQQNITNITTNVNRSVGSTELRQETSTLVSACGSLGGKFELLYERKLYKNIAQDIVASSLNKLASTGAELIGFSEYILTENKEISEQIERAIESELKQYNCTQMSVKTEISDKNKTICGYALGANPVFNEIVSGDIIVGLSSNGLHFNGYDRIKNLYAQGELSEDDMTECLKPAYNYYNEVIELFRQNKIKAGVNITRGGIYNCINKVLPKGLKADLNLKHILTQPIFDKLKELTGNEFYSIFNGGIGFCLIAERACHEMFFDECQKYDPIVLGVIK